MKKFNCIMILAICLTSSISFAAPRKISSQDQYSPLCIDLARRIVTGKVSYYQNFKRNSKLAKRSTASSVRFESFPQVVSHPVDKKVIKLILSSIQDKKRAKNFTQKLDAEDKLINGIAKVMNQEGKPFMNQCVNLYQQAEKKCNAYISKDFNKFTQCLSTITSEESLAVARFVPFVSYKHKARSLASNKSRR